MASPRPRFILASASPRRRDLLAQLGVTPDAIEPADIDETEAPGELAGPLSLRLAREKGAVIAARHEGAVVLSADTVVAVGRRVLPKAEDEKTARECIALLSGRSHRVYTGLAVYGPGDKVRLRTVETRVKVKRLSGVEVEQYIATGEWHGKAGGYGIQGAFGAFIIQIIGSFTGVVGLPLYETAQLLCDAFGHPLPLPAEGA